MSESIQVWQGDVYAGTVSGPLFRAGSDGVVYMDVYRDSQKWDVMNIGKTEKETAAAE